MNFVLFCYKILRDFSVSDNYKQENVWSYGIMSIMDGWCK